MVTKNSRPTRREIAKAACQHSCKHIAGPPFGFGQQGAQPQIIGQQMACCHCGAVFVQYVGIVEEGHGPHVVFQQVSPIVQARIELPAGAKR